MDHSPGWRLTLIITILAVAGLITGVRLFTAAFPEASIDFKLSRNDASAKAAALLGRMGHKLEDYRQVIVFDYDESAKTYMEREIGLEKANRLMSSEINVWRWKYRRFRPLHKEEYRVYLDPGGRLVGYQHLIEEGQEGASLAPEKARETAVGFLRTTVGLPLDQYTLVEEKIVERPKRKDHVLTWERKGFKVQEATYRVEVTVQGEAVGGYNEFLKIPEKWQRTFQEMRSHNELLQNLATVFFVLLVLAMVIVLFVRMSQRLVRWRLPLILGGVMFGLQMLEGFNSLPLSLVDFDTTRTMGAFLVSIVGLIIMRAIGAALLVFLPVAAGEILYRQYFPSKLSMRNLLSPRATGTAEFMQASLTGYLFVMVHFGFLTAFYYYGKNLGFWSPADINYTNAVSTAFPWITPLALSFNASVFEECTFRLFAIPFLKRYLKSTWLAILIPAFVWGFLHSAYPQQPSYVRGIEVGLIGVAAGWIMVRYGILATLVWHYVVDAFLIGLFLFRSSSLYFQVSGSIVVGGLLIPLLLAVGVWLKRRSFADATALTNAADTPEMPAPAPVSSAAPGPELLPATGVGTTSGSVNRRLAVMVAVGVVGLLALFLLKVERFGDFAVFRINAREASRMSDAVLEKIGVPHSAFKKTTDVVDAVDDMQSTYIYRQGGNYRLNRIYATQLPGVLWKTRYFKPLKKEEYWVSFTVQGDFYNYRHLVDEKASGANLEKDEALSRAVAYLSSAKGLDVTGWKLVRSESKKRDQRTDHEFEWEYERDAIGQARFRVGVGVVGSEVQGFHKYLKVPEEWELKEKEQTVLRALLGFSKIILSVAIVILFIILFALHLYRRRVDWQSALKKTAWLVLAIPVIYINNLSALVSRYPTEIQYKVFWATVSIGFVIFLLFVGGGIFMLLALAQSLVRQIVANQWWWPADRKERLAQVFFGIVAGYGLELGLSGLTRFLSFIADRFGWQTSHVADSIFLSAGESYPLLGSVARSYLAGFLGLAVLVCVVGILLHYISSPVKRLGLVGLALLLASGGAVRAPADVLMPLLANTAWVGALFLLGKKYIGVNLVAFGTWLFVRALGPEVVFMARQPERFLGWNGRIGVVILLLPLLYALVLRLGTSSASELAEKS